MGQVCGCSHCKGLVPWSMGSRCWVDTGSGGAGVGRRPGAAAWPSVGSRAGIYLHYLTALCSSASFPKHKPGKIQMNKDISKVTSAASLPSACSEIPQMGMWSLLRMINHRGVTWGNMTLANVWDLLERAFALTRFIHALLLVLPLPRELFWHLQRVTFLVFFKFQSYWGFFWVWMNM